MELEELIELGAQTRDACTSALIEAGQRLHGRQATNLLFVQGSLAMRLNRTHAGIEALINERLPTEAAILAVSLFELRLDILYISDREKLAKDWLSHTNQKHQPWNVKQKIDTVYRGDDDKIKLQRNAHQFLCAIKHGNPMAGSLGFGFRHDGSKISISNREPDDRITSNFCRIIIHLSTLQLLEGSLRAINVVTAGEGISPEAANRLNSYSRIANELSATLKPILDDEAKADPGWVTPATLMDNLVRWGKVT